MSVEREKSVAEESLGSELDYSGIMRAQIPLDRAAREIEETFKGQENLGYTSLTVDAKSNALVIYWKGSVPAVTERAMDSVRQRGINITVIPAKYSREELKAEIRNLIEWDRKNVESAYRAHTWSPMRDGSGILIYVLKRSAQVEEKRNASGMIRSTKEAPRAVLLSDW